MSQRSLARAIVVPATATGGGGGAPTDATYITQTANGTLSAEQALASLATGMLKNTTGTGVLSIGTEGTDYYKPGGTDVTVADGGTGASTAAAGFDALAPTTTRGDVIYRNATGNTRLAAGTSGQYLQTKGNAADPVFAAAGTAIVTFSQGQATGWSAGAALAQNSTYYFAAPLTVNPGTTDANSEYYIPAACTLRAVYFNWIVFGTKGTVGQTATISIRLNHTTDISIGSTDCSLTANIVSNTGLSQALVAGDILNCKIVTPVTWTVVPTTTFVQAYLYFDRP